jgi:ABC-type transport system involved in cytochrome bd biosynthesis fused ATPase/permease subunit
LVTHQVHLLPFFDKIIVMDNGQVKACGELDLQLLLRGYRFF